MSRKIKKWVGNLNRIGSAKLTLNKVVSCPTKMEFPEDILLLIREYAKPRFKYFREYNRACKLFRVHSFRNLRKGLLKNPERILPALSRLEYCDVEYHRISIDFQTRYLEYISCKRIHMKRQTLHVALDKLERARDKLYEVVNCFSTM